MARQFNLIPPICEQAEYHMFQREKVEVQLPELFHKIGTNPGSSPSCSRWCRNTRAAPWLLCPTPGCAAGVKMALSGGKGGGNTMRPFHVDSSPEGCTHCSSLSIPSRVPQHLHSTPGSPGWFPCCPSCPLHPRAAQPRAEGSTQGGQVTLLCSPQVSVP